MNKYRKKGIMMKGFLTKVSSEKLSAGEIGKIVYRCRGAIYEYSHGAHSMPLDVAEVFLELLWKHISELIEYADYVQALIKEKKYELEHNVTELGQNTDE